MATTKSTVHKSASKRAKSSRVVAPRTLTTMLPHIAETKFAVTFHLSPDMIMISAESDGLCLEVNEAFLRLTGYERAEVVGHTTLELNLWADRDDRQRMLDALRQERAVRDMEIRYRRKSGDVGCAIMFAERIDMDGRACLLTMAQDITERKRMEAEREQLVQAVQRHTRLLDAILSSTPDLFFLHDHEGRYLFVSPGVQRALGVPAEQLVGYTWRELGFPADVGEAFDQRLHAVFASGEPNSSTVSYQDEHGQRRDMEAILTPVTGDDGRVSMAASTVRDITAHKRAQEALSQLAADLKVRNDELDTFAQTVAHDLKSPLGNVLGFLELLVARPDLPESKRLDYLHIIQRNGFKMNSIIEELLLLAKVRKSDISMQALDMGRIVSEGLHRLTFMLDESTATIYAPNHWPSAHGYPAWVEEVWVNYISNAIKYGGQPPHIELGGDLLPNGAARFWVKDNGVGLPPELKTQLFQPFPQLSTLRATGHGLGLSIVRQIVEKMGGQVGVEEGPDGCRFWFTLPSTE